MAAPIVIADGITRIGPKAKGAVVVNASHGGLLGGRPEAWREAGRF